MNHAERREFSRREAGMNIFEFIGFVLLIGGIVWGVYAAANQGLWAAVKGGLLGAGKAFLIFAAFMLCILVPLSLGLLYRPMFPRCRSGKCKSKNFRYLYLDTEAPPEDSEIEQRYGGKLVQCACGERYIRNDRERCFYHVRDDRSVAPFMKYRVAGRWQEDKDPAP